jgi:hypothetical protein
MFDEAMFIGSYLFALELIALLSEVTDLSEV